MNKIKGYQLNKNYYYKGKRSIVFRGRRTSDNQPVIVKTCLSDFPSVKELNRLQREFKIGQEVSHKNVIKYFGLERCGHGWAIINEDFGATSLAEIIPENGVDPLRFLKIAIPLAEALGEIHNLEITHKDVKPRNIVVNEKTNEIKLIDFGIASHLRDEPSFHSNLHNIEGDLAYISPEQTGRMNRGVDFRSDFYSLGVTFYEVLTGRLPFISKDPLELVYSHIAKSPTSPTEIRSKIPQPISDVVMKLMQKNAEDRYQSAYGLKKDLDECIRQLETSGKIISFSAGKKDLSGNFQIRQKLYGRDAEIKQLLDSFDQVNNGEVKSVLTLVAGYSGIGKSSLIHEIYKPLAKKNGYFISGKFDQFRRNIPYASIIQAFQQLIKLILTESKEKIIRWKAEILKAVGQNGQVIIDVIPEVEYVIGPQSPVPVLGAVENSNRFNRVFLNFSQVFAKENHPMVIFLDDLQWADPSTFHLIELMLTDPDCEHLFFIGAYRDNEVNDSHPLVKTLKDIQKKRGAQILSLKPLELENTVSLVSDSFESSRERAQELAKVVQEKTRGNPFFIKMFLKTLHQEKLIQFHPGEGIWEWDAGKIREMGITDNVVDFMVRQIKKLPRETEQILSIAAIIGHQFDLKLLSHIQDIPVARIAEMIWPAVKEGLILPLNQHFNWVKHNWESDPTVMFRFSHDRVQQAADSLLPQEEKNKLHLDIGRILRTLIKEDESFDRIFTIVDHLNKGRSLIEDKKELLQLCDFNLIAAKKARLSSAYQPALTYVRNGNDLLPENSWDENYELTLSYFIEKGEILYLNSEWDEAIKTFDVALDYARDLVDRCNISKHKTNLYRMKNDLNAALYTGLKGLAELDIYLKPFPDQADVTKELDRVQPLIDAEGIENLYDLPELEDPLKLAAMELLAACFAPAYFLGSRLISIIGPRMSEITIKHGNSPLAEVGYIFYSAISLAVDLKDFDNAYKLGALALKLNDQKYHEKVNEALLLDMWGTFVCHHKEPISNAKKHLMRGFFSGVENGSYQWAGYCAMINLFMTFWGGDSLQDVTDKIDKILPGLKKVDPNMAQYYYAVKATVHNLTHPVEDVVSLSSTIWPKMDEVMKLGKEQNDLLTLLVDTTCRLSLANWHNKPQDALRLAEEGEVYVEGVPGVFINPVFRFHQALAFAAGCDMADSTRRQEYIERIQATADKFEHFAKHCPENYLHQSLLIKAELARILGNPLEAMDLYDQAIKSAQENGFSQNEAFANELAAKFYLSLKKEKIAKIYLTETLYAYKIWGADAKAARLEESYPHLNLKAPGVKTPDSFYISPSDSISQAPMDLETVMKASQAISQEIQLDDLLATIMENILQSAGAQRGCLILKEKNQLMMAANTLAGPGKIQISQSRPLEEGKDISGAIVNYVLRTRENVVLDNACQEGMFMTDPYIANNKIKSLLCMPIQHKAVVTGVLYLENNTTTAAFTEERVKILNVHLSQTAISLENARLYAQTTALNRDLQKEIQVREQAQEETYQTVQNAMDGIITINEKGIIQTFNPAAESIFGFKTQEILGENIARMMTQPDSNEHDDYLARYLETGTTSIMGVTREVQGQRKDGSVFPLEISVSEMFLGDKRMFIGIVRDITLRKETEAELKATNAELEKFTYTASHDLQEPLRKVITFGDLLELSCSGKLEEREIDYIRRMQKAAFRMKDLIEDLLAYSRLNYKGSKFEMIDLGIIVQEVISDLEIQIESTGGDIQIYGLPTVEADKIQMRQLFQNIISNGLKYSKPDAPPKIVVQSSAIGNNYHAISIQDNGVGIDPKHWERVFEPFKRLHSDRDIPGSGMGLFICQKIAAFHCGSISVESKSREGTTFIINLPEKQPASD